MNDSNHCIHKLRSAWLLPMMALSAVVDQYTNELKVQSKQLQEQYKQVRSSANEATFLAVCFARINLPRVREMVECAKDKVKATVYDVSPVPLHMHWLLVQTELWVAVCLVALGMFQLVGASLLAPLLSLIFDTNTSMLLTYVLLPLHYIVSVKTQSISSGQAQRSALLSLSIIIGLLSGFNLSDKYLSFYGPPMFLMPAAVGLAAGFAGHMLEEQRDLYLTATIGAGVVAYIVFGLTFNSLGLNYFLWVAVASVASVIDLQYKIQRDDSLDSPAASACMTVLIHLMVQSAMFFVFGGAASLTPTKDITKKAARAAAKKAAKAAANCFFCL